MDKEIILRQNKDARMQLLEQLHYDQVFDPESEKVRADG